MNMPVIDMPVANFESIAAGDFGAWLIRMRASLQGEAGTDVPCGDCVGCCVSSYFIPIRPMDSQARKVIPVQLLVAAPGQSAGHSMMGYRDDGTCPMLSDRMNDRKCTIYHERPQTCRDYDCRIFAAAGLEAGDASKTVINERVRAWQFSYVGDADKRDHEAVLAAAHFIKNKRDQFPSQRAPTASTGIAVLAIKSYSVFLDQACSQSSDQEIAMAIIQASGDFDANCEPLSKS